MNKEEEKERYPSHELIEYDVDYDTFVQGLNHRYKESDLKVVQRIFPSWILDTPMIYKMNTDHEWVVKNSVVTYEEFQEGVAQITYIEISNRLILPSKNTDYIFPSFNEALLSRDKTAKLRVKRVKPACMKRGGLVQEDQE